MEIRAERGAESGDLSKGVVTEVLIGVEVARIFVGNEVEGKAIKIDIGGGTDLLEAFGEVGRESFDGNTDCSVGDGLASDEVVTGGGVIVGIQR